jgi:NAD(P)-dependent dehydrogenase (short-subunit alcohol dehydrogenase family)
MDRFGPFWATRSFSIRVPIWIVVSDALCAGRGERPHAVAHPLLRAARSPDGIWHMEEAVTVEQSTPNPTQAQPRPPYPEPTQSYPGSEADMHLRPDYGEQSYRGSGRLTGKKALITGADSGIGRAVAVAFAREGADVLISYLNEEQDAAETARVVREAGRTCIQVPGDISERSQCDRLVETAMSEFGGLDILVNNAAYQMSREGIEELTDDEFDHTLKTNLYAMFWLCRAALPRMREGGAIINTTSIQAYQPSPTLLAYASSKGAILTFTKGLSQEAIKRGIRVNAVAPGPIWTPLIVSTMPPDSVKNFGENTPAGRAGQPVELAPVYVFLASPESSYITGEVIGATGGKPLA